MPVAPDILSQADTNPARTSAGPVLTHTLRLILLVVISLLVHGWLLVRTNTTARDSVGFAQLALQYESPELAVTQNRCESWLDVLRYGEPPHPPGYPLAVLAMSKLVRSVTTQSLPEQMLLSAQLASVVAGVLLVFPSYALGCLLFGRFVGLTAAVILQVLPVLARVTTDGLTEAWYLLFYTTAAALGTWAILQPRLRTFLLAGMASGLAYLVRPEGLIGALAVAAAIVATHGLNRKTVLQLAAIAFGAALFAGPYMVLVGGYSLKPSAQSVLAPATAQVPASSGPLFAVNYSPLTDGARAAWVPRAILHEAFKAFHYGVLIYALIGLALASLTVRTRPELRVTLFLAAGNFMLLTILAYRAGYVSERHTLPLVVIGTIYATFTFEELPRQLARLPGWYGRLFDSPAWKWVTFAAVLVSCLPAITTKTLHENRAGHRFLADHLRDHAQPDDVIVDPYSWAQYLSGRSVRGVPSDPVDPPVRWAVLEDGEPPHTTHTRLEAALAVRNDGRTTEAAAWIDPDRKGRRIVLYRQELRPR